MAFEFHSELVDKYTELKYSLLDAQTFSQEHFGFPPIYYKIMETDDVRVGAYKKAFQQYNFKDKIVCEAGVGTLALTQHFLDDVKKAYLIENNPDLRDFIEQKIEENGWQDKVVLLFDNAMTLELPEQVDFIVGELMSIYCGNEYQVQIFKHLRKFLKPGGKLLPERIVNIGQLAFAEFDQHKHYPINFTRHLPEQLSLQQEINTIDLYSEEVLRIQKNIQIVPIMSGTVNSLYMHSFVQVAEGCNFTGTDSLMPPTVCKLEKEVNVHQGHPVTLHVDFGYGTSLDEVRFWVDV
jgi:predicted RNA methylase